MGLTNWSSRLRFEIEELRLPVQSEPTDDALCSCMACEEGKLIADRSEDVEGIEES